MITIRYAIEEDAKALGKIHANSWKVAYKGIVPDEILDRMTPKRREEYFNKAIVEGKEKNAIALLDQVPVGFICIGKCRDEDKDRSFGEIWGIYLDPEFWNQGMGTILFQWGIDELKKEGYQKASLWVLEENRQARAFYEKNGFSFDGTVKKLNFGKILKEYRYIKKF